MRTPSLGKCNVESTPINAYRTSLHIDGGTGILAGGKLDVGSKLQFVPNAPSWVVNLTDKSMQKKRLCAAFGQLGFRETLNKWWFFSRSDSDRLE